MKKYGWTTWNLEDLEKVVELPMGIAAYGDWGSDDDHVGLRN